MITDMTMLNKKIIIITLLLNIFFLHKAVADERITMGAKLLVAGWQGDNGSVSSSFNSDEGAQLAFSISYTLDKFYTGLSLQSGKYTFKSIAPDQFTSSARVSSSNNDIEHREFDLLAGYYFWDNISLFVDIKNVNNTWTNNNYQQDFGGLGFGVSGYIPVRENLTLFGSAGFVGNGDIKDTNKIKVGDGSSGALDLGAVFRLSDNSTINAGMKFRTYNFEYTDNTTQTYYVNGIFVGYNHSFTL